MTAAVHLPDSVWLDKYKYDDAERLYHEKVDGAPGSPLKSRLVQEIAKAREQIKTSLECVDDVVASLSSSTSSPKYTPVSASQLDAFAKKLDELTRTVSKIDARLSKLEKQCSGQQGSRTTSETRKASESRSSVKEEVKEEEDDDDVDLFGSESEEDEEAAKVKEQRLAEYAAKKSNKPTVIAKSNIILFVKPWDDETDMKEMERQVRLIVSDGLVWGASKLVPVGYGINKLQISCVVEDDKVSVDWLTETIEEIEELVQSVDIAAFNKV